MSPDQQPRFLRSIPEGVTRFVRSNPSLNSLSQGNSRSFTHRPMYRPFVGHKDFCCSLDRIHVDAIPADQDAHFGAEPNSAGHGA